MIDWRYPKRVWNTVLFLLPIIFLLESYMIGLSSNVLAGTNQIFHMSTLCGRRRENRLQKMVEGAVLISENEPNLDCVLTFQTDTAVQKFLLRFDKLQLECNDHLYVYEGENTHGEFVKDLSCHTSRDDFGNYITNANHVTLRYKTSYGRSGNGFTLVMTAFNRYSRRFCQQFRCSNEFCIDRGLTCDGYNHCIDNSDEDEHAYCTDSNTVGRILGLGVGIFIAVVVGVFVICFVFIISITMCICKNRALGRRRPPPPPPPMNSTPGSESQQGLQHFSSWIHGPPCYRPWDEKSSSSVSIGKVTTTTATPSSATSTPTFAPTLSGKPASPSGRDHRLQRPSTKSLLSHKSYDVKSDSFPAASSHHEPRSIATLPPPEKGEWLV